MIPTLTTAGLGPVGDLDTLIGLASRNGFAAVDTGPDPLSKFVAAHGIEGAREYLAAHRVRLGNLGLPVEWRKDEDTFRQGLTRLTEAAELAVTMGCTRFGTWVLPSVEEPAHLFTLKMVRRMRVMAGILGAYGLQLAVEYVAPYHLRTLFPNPFIHDQAGMLAMIDAIDRPEVGLLLDSIHWHCAGASAAELEQLPLDRIVHVHLNDTPAGPVEEVRDNGRVFPGEGAIDLTTFLGILKRKGYSHFVALEVLTPTPPTAPAEVMAQKAAATVLPYFA